MQKGDVMGITLRTKLFLLVIISISMAAIPIIFSAYEDFRSSNIELERKTFRSITSFVKDGLEARYFDILTYQATNTLQSKNQLRRIAMMLDSNLHILEKFPSKDQSTFLQEWIKQLQQLNIHIEVYDANKNPLVKDPLFTTLKTKYNLRDAKNRSFESLLNHEQLPINGEFTVFEHKDSSKSDPILIFLLPSPENQHIILTAINISDISKNALDAEEQLAKTIREKIEGST